MRYTARQLQLMAQVVTDAKTNSTHKYHMFMANMRGHTKMTQERLEIEIEKYL